MGLSVTLSNALSGMRVGQKALDVLSNNVANAGTPGYHRRSLSVIDMQGANSTYAREGALTRTFNASLQSHYTRALSNSSFASVQTGYLDRVQVLFGKPGTTGSLDSIFAKFEFLAHLPQHEPGQFRHACRDRAVGAGDGADAQPLHRRHPVVAAGDREQADDVGG